MEHWTGSEQKTVVLVCFRKILSFIFVSSAFFLFAIHSRWCEYRNDVGDKHTHTHAKNGCCWKCANALVWCTVFPFTRVYYCFVYSIECRRSDRKKLWKCVIDNTFRSSANAPTHILTRSGHACGNAYTHAKNVSLEWCTVHAFEWECGANMEEIHRRHHALANDFLCHIVHSGIFPVRSEAVSLDPCSMRLNVCNFCFFFSSLSFEVRRMSPSEGTQTHIRSTRPER